MPGEIKRFEDGCYTCRPGYALIGRILAGEGKMHYTRVAVGRGTLSDGADPRNQTDVPDYVMDAGIASVSSPVDGECIVSVQINSLDVEKGFFATSLLLYAQDPATGENIPYTFLSIETEPEWIRPSSAAVGKVATFDLIAAVGDVEDVSAAIDPTVFATIGALEAHNNDPNAHGGISACKHESLIIPVTAWSAINNGAQAVIELDWIRADMLALVVVGPYSAMTTCMCDMSPYAIPDEGVLHLSAARIPDADIAADLYCIALNGGFAGDNGCTVAGTMPIATRTTPGAVRIGPGIDITPDGTISVESSGCETADDDEVNDALEAILGQSDDSDCETPTATDDEVGKALDDILGPEEA